MQLAHWFQWLIHIFLFYLFCRLCSDRSYCDAVFRVYGEKAHVHRCILAVRCPSLHEKLHKRLEERKVITLKDLQVPFYILVAFV